MELKIESKLEDPLLQRTRLEGSMTYDKATPSIAEVTKEISGQLKKEENTIKIRNIYNTFGTKHANIIAYAYKDEKTKLEVEQQPKKPKDKSKEETADTKVESKPEEKPAEAQKPEEKPKAEDKPAEAQKPEEKPKE